MLQIAGQYLHQCLQRGWSSFSALWQGYRFVCLWVWLLNGWLVGLVDAYRIADGLCFSCKNILDILGRDLRFRALGNQHLLSSKSLLRVMNLLLSRWVRKTVHEMELFFSLLFSLLRLNLMSCLVLRRPCLLGFCLNLFLLIWLVNGGWNQIKRVVVFFAFLLT